MHSLRGKAWCPVLRPVLQYATRTRRARSPHRPGPGSKVQRKREGGFQELSEDDYVNPPEGSYFSHVLERKKKLESLYDELQHAPAGSEHEAMQRLIQAVVNS